MITSHPALLERKKQGLPEMGVLRESDGSWYLREERGGFVLGPYEKGAPCCYVPGTSFFRKISIVSHPTLRRRCRECPHLPKWA